MRHPRVGCLFYSNHHHLFKKIDKTTSLLYVFPQKEVEKRLKAWNIKEKSLFLHTKACENGRSSERQHTCMIGRVAPDEGKANGLRLSNRSELHCIRLAPSLQPEPKI
jgi:hypothetical protein